MVVSGGREIPVCPHLCMQPWAWVLFKSLTNQDAYVPMVHTMYVHVNNIMQVDCPRHLAKSVTVE